MKTLANKSKIFIRCGDSLLLLVEPQYLAVVAFAPPTFQLVNQDLRTERYLELLERYVDHPERDVLIAKEMGWFDFSAGEEGWEASCDGEDEESERIEFELEEEGDGDADEDHGVEAARDG